MKALNETDWAYLEALKDVGRYSRGNYRRCHIDILWLVFGEYCRLKGIWHYIPRNFKLRDIKSRQPYGRMYGSINHILVQGERRQATKYGKDHGLIELINNRRWQFIHA